MPVNKMRLVRFVLFLIPALIISNLFRFQIIDPQALLSDTPKLALALRVLGEGSGVLLGALLALYFLRKKENLPFSLFGTSRAYSLILFLIPLIITSFLGVSNEMGMDYTLYAIYAVSLSFVYCLMEELGWRGYLKMEFGFLKDKYRYFLIGFLWYFWHLSFLKDSSFGGNLIFLGMMIFGSWGLGMLMRSTRSLMAVAAFHLLIQMVFLNGFFKQGLSFNDKLFVFFITLPCFFLIIKRWEKEMELKVASEEEEMALMD